MPNTAGQNVTEAIGLLAKELAHNVAKVVVDRLALSDGHTGKAEELSDSIATEAHSLARGSTGYATAAAALAAVIDDNLVPKGE